MERLTYLVLQNLNNLDKLRMRLRYSRNILKEGLVLDTHQQYGPYSDHWEEWSLQAEFMHQEIITDVSTTSIFVSDLKDFCINYENTKTPTAEHIKSCTEMQKLAEEAISWQKDMIKMADERISLHREFTQRLLLVEVFDSIDED